jgi:hypothetical protein
VTYPNQPGPQGQPPYWQQQTGQYPQQPPPPGPQQPPYGQQWYGQYGAPPPTPPPRQKTGLWVGLTIAAVAVIALAVTAFAWPGFLLSDDKGGNNGGSGGGAPSANCQSPGNSDDPQVYGQAIADCINAKNKGVLQSLTCSGGNSETKRLIDGLDRVGSVKLNRTFTVSDDEARADIQSAQGNDGFQAVLTKNGQTWCWKRNDALGAH